MLVLAAVISTLQLTGPVPRDGGDYLLVPFIVPAGTVELTVAHDDGSATQILDWGVWSPEGFRGWGGGLTDPAVIGVAASSRGYLPGPITAGQWLVVVGKAKLGASAGAYTIDVELRDAGGPLITPAPSQPWTAVTLATERRWYAGDFHVHSQDSGDATATLDQIAAFARGRDLDFVVLTDHNTSAQLEHQAATQATLTDLLLVRGAEITTYGGHGNGVGVGRYVDHRVGLGGVSATTIIADVVAQGAVFVVNHPELRVGDLCIGCGWDHADTPWAMVGGLELQTGNTEATGSTFTPRVILLWDALLDDGARLAAIGGSDDHRGGTETGTAPSLIGSPTTMVLADALSEAAIVDAVKAGRTVVKMRGPDDPMVILTLRDRSDATRVAGVGDTLRDVRELAIEVEAPGADGAIAELWRDGVRLVSAPIVGGAARFDADPRGGVERFRVELTRDAVRITVTSHAYVDGEPPAPDDGCGCSGGVGASPGVALALLALRRRRPRV